MKLKIVQNPKQGIEAAKRIIYKTVDSKTALFLSGGTTPKLLYAKLAHEKKLHPGAVALVDERYGLPLHANSNEKMIKETGLLSYLSAKNIPFYGILQKSYRHYGKGVPDGTPASRISNVSRDSGQGTYSKFTCQARMTLEKVAEDYDKKVKQLLSNFSKCIAILGIGEDGHTAGLPAQTQNSIPDSIGDKSQNYVIGISNFSGEFRQRITLTFNALSKMDLLIVLAVGRKKKEALVRMFEKGSIEEIPARFYKKPDIAKKTILITDQKV